MSFNLTKDGRPLAWPINDLTRALEIKGRGGVSATPPPAVKSGAWGSEITVPQQMRDIAASAPVTKEVEYPPIEYDIGRTGSVNFNNIQGIDLVKNTITVDGLDFPLAPEDVKQLRLLCVDCVLNAVVTGLKDMLNTSGIEANMLLGSLKEGVRGRSSATETVQEGPPVPGEGAGTQGSVEQSEQE